MKRCVSLFAVVLVFLPIVFGAGGTHTASEIKGGTFAETSPYSIGTVTDSQRLTLYQTGADSITVYAENRLSRGQAVVGIATSGTGATGIGVYGSHDTSGTGVKGLSVS